VTCVREDEERLPEASGGKKSATASSSILHGANEERSSKRNDREEREDRVGEKWTGWQRSPMRKGSKCQDSCRAFGEKSGLIRAIIYVGARGDINHAAGELRP